MLTATIYKTKDIKHDPSYNKIVAIKTLRELTGYSLRETKDILDALEDNSVKTLNIKLLNKHKFQTDTLAEMGLALVFGVHSISILYSDFMNEFLKNDSFSEEEKDNLKKDFYRFEEELKKKLFLEKLENSL